MKPSHYNPNSISITHRFSILFAAFITFIALAIFLSIVHFTLFSNTFSASLLLSACAFVFLNLIIELHGKNNADKVIYSGLYVILFIFAIASFMKYITTPQDALYDFWSSPITTPKLLIFLVIAYLVALKSNLFVYLKLKNYTQKKHLWLRHMVATLILFTIFTTLMHISTYKSNVDMSAFVKIYLQKLLIQYLFIIISLPLVYILVVTFKAFNKKTKRGYYEKHNANYAKSTTGAKKYRKYSKRN